MMAVVINSDYTTIRIAMQSPTYYPREEKTTIKNLLFYFCVCAWKDSSLHVRIGWYKFYLVVFSNWYAATVAVPTL